jgi:peptidoglycan DL-endopeptidase CwlO
MLRSSPFRSLLALVIFAGVFAGAPVGRAAAGPVDDERAKAKAVAEQRLTIIEAAERLNQRQQATGDELKHLVADETHATNDLAIRDQALRTTRATASGIAVETYVHGSRSPVLDGFVLAGQPDTAPLREAYATSIYGDAADAIDAARAARDDLDRAARVVRDLIASRKSLQAGLERDQADLAAKERELADLAARTDEKIAALVSEEQERLAREAEARAQAQRKQAQELQFTTPAVTTRPAGTVGPTASASKPPKSSKPAATTAPPTQPTRPVAAPTAAPRAPVTTTKATVPRPATTTPPPVDEGDPPAAPDPAPVPAPAPATTRKAPITTDAPDPAPEPEPAPPKAAPPAPSSGAAVAVAEAKRQLNKPYKFGAAGPDSFDCSGLTQWAWAKAGVYMDHFTGSQYRAFPRVSIDQLQPGDLVFFNADLGHMGMYIGGGQIIHAPRTGDVVRIASLSGRNVVGAVRPG